MPWAEAAVRAETLGLGPHRMKTFEYLVALACRNTRALVANLRFDGILARAQGDRDLAIGRGERHRIVEQVFEYPFEPGRYAHHHERPAPPGLDLDHAVVAIGTACTSADCVVDERGQVDRLEGRAAQFGIDPAGVGDWPAGRRPVLD